MTDLLKLHGVTVGYGQTPVVHGADLTVREGELVTLVGANGAGKSTLLKAISGVLTVSSGSIEFGGETITKWSPPRVARAGIAHVPENRRVFRDHSIEANLLLGGYVTRRAPGAKTRARLDSIYDRFPVLGERRKRPAGGLSGGEQQMLAIGMALMAEPRLLILDEPSLGLAPIVVERVYKQIKELHEAGTTILLVEQMANLALSVADRGAIMRLGHATEMESHEALREAIADGYL